MTNTAPAYESTTDAGGVARRLRDAESIVVLTHVKPDGDAIGSSVALARAINLRHERSGGSGGAVAPAECWYAAPVPPWTPAMTAGVRTRVVEDNQPVPGVPAPEAIAIVDTGARSQLGPFLDWLAPRRERTTIVDHHLDGNADLANDLLIDPTRAAACEIVADVACELLDLDSPAALPAEIAEPLYLGLATDTGWFRHGNVTPRVMRLAADLIEAGADGPKLLGMAYQRERLARLRLMERALRSLEVYEDKRLAVMRLTKRDFAETGAAPGDSGGFVDLPQAVERIRVVALLTEAVEPGPGGPLTKVSMRSKGIAYEGREPVDVNAVCQTMGGGGHKLASGARVALSLDETAAKIVEAVS